ncbi:sodium/pantothenate symporter [Salsuginibacillus kocurii]|uniref:sodium/pantothenate symporter n=1 Tax=Salsuginibacillus kocurii TaxID=427078 RepID=UPI00036B51BA|nr:sodium/pantothenate symporter [Salsuginibacillus kocurii]
MNWSIIIPLIAFLVLIFATGFWASGYIRNKANFLQEYFLGSRELGGLVLAMTMVATFGSASSFVGGPGAAYTEGLGWVLLAMTQVVTGYFVLMILGKKFAVVARKYDAVTLVDYLRKRYNSRAVALVGALSIMIFLFAAMTAQWVGGTRLIEAVTGLTYTQALVLFAFVVLIYVLLGGFRAVAVTDTIQGLIMFVGTIVILAGAIIAGGGLPQIMADLANENANLVSPYGHDGSLTPLYLSSFWILVGVGVIGLPQVAVRAMSYRNARAMHRAIIVGTIVITVMIFCIHFAGVLARPIMPGVSDPDSVMPLLAMEVLPAWVAGIVLAAPLAAIMSTVDSLLLLVSSAVVRDVYLHEFKKDATERHVRRVSLGVTGVLGIVVFALALTPPELLIWMNLFAFGGLQAAFIWPLVLGLYWNKAEKHGALAAMVTGVVMYVFLHIFIPEPLGMHTVVLPVVASLLLFVLTSKLFPTQDKQSELSSVSMS